MSPIIGSVWQECAAPPLEGDHVERSLTERWDLVVVGGGIAGLAAALAARDAGGRVCLLEARAVGERTTAHSTAKVTSGHGAITAEIAARHDDAAAIAYQQANDSGYDAIAAWVAATGEDVCWSPQRHVVYAESTTARKALEESVRIGRLAGSTVTPSPAPPWSNGIGYAWSRSALVHPLALARALARLARRRGILVVQGVRVDDVRRTGSDLSLELAGGAGRVRADRVLIATHLPVHDPDLHTTRVRVQRHSAVAVPIDGVPPESTVSADDGFSTRPVTLPSGRSGAVVVGGGHRSGVVADADPWREVVSRARIALRSEEPDYVWTAEDPRSPDLLPYLGPSRRDPKVLVVTGMNGWGFTNAAAAAMQLPGWLDAGADSEDSQTERATRPWRARRVLARGGVREWTANALWSTAAFTSDHVRAVGADASPLAPGDGIVVGGPLRPVAISRTADGTMRAVSARCTHLGCLVRWNRWEQSWDCPCHGSRFAPDGEVLDGPAANPLAAADVPDGLSE